MGTAIMIFQFLLSMTILIVLHECGHFFPARWFKTRVEKFYLFFDPYFSLLKKKIGETEYGIGWLPLGGYVKISGMVDESFDTEQLKSEPQPWEFRSKPAWQRLIIMLGGVTVNFLLGFFIFAMLLWINGINYISNDKLEHGIAVDSLASAMGFRDGDKIIKVGDKNFDRFESGLIIKTLLLEDNSDIMIHRNGQTIVLQVPQEQKSLLAKPETKNLRLWEPRMLTLIDSVLPGSNADKGGLKPGDQILAVNQNPALYYHEFRKIVSSKKNENFTIRILRGTDTLDLNVSTNETGSIGFFTKGIPFEKEDVGFFESFPLGIQRGLNFLGIQLKAFGKMFSGTIKAQDSLGGFASIAGMFQKTWDWTAFWSMTATLSIILAFMNLLPIPALDGGYVVFLLIEVIIGRKVPDKIVEKATMIGFILLLGLLLFANGLDVFRWLGK